MGRMIVIEGLDGSGKTTQGNLLTQYLKGQGVPVRPLSFPNYGSRSCTLVDMYLEGTLGQDPDDINGYAASMFYAADRYISYTTDWHGDYQKADTVLVATRYTTANAYHQLAKLPREEWDNFLLWLYDFEYTKLGLPVPDDIVLLSMEPLISSACVEKRSRETGEKKDIHELDADYLHRCHAAAQYAADKGGWHIIDCAPEGVLLSPKEILAKIIYILDL